MGISSVIFLLGAVVLPGCSNQDPGQPAIGSISADDKPDMKIPAKKSRAAK